VKHFKPSDIRAFDTAANHELTLLQLWLGWVPACAGMTARMGRASTKTRVGIGCQSFN
jgi:hypothetical protein